VNPAAIDPIVPPALFEAVQVEHARRMRRYTAPELISLLQTCYRRHGKVNAQIIAKDPDMPDPQLFSRAFGSLVRAYDMAGLPCSLMYAFVDTKRKLLPIQERIFSQVEALAHAAGATTERMPAPFTLKLNGDLRIRVEVAAMRRPKGASPDWRVTKKLGIHFIITSRVHGDTGECLDYFLIPVGDMATRTMYLRDSNLDRYSSWRFASLSEMFGMAVAGQ
jgi:hypothetical protein